MRDRARALLVLALAACSGPPPATPRPCDWSAEGDVDLTARGAHDVVTVSVAGPSCAEALLLLAIRTSEGKTIYRFDAPLPVFFSATGDAASLPEDAEARMRDLVAELVRPQSFRSVGSLPSWAPGEIDDGVRFYQYLLPKDEVARLEAQPLFHHWAGYRYALELAFDPRAGAAVAVLETWQ